METATYIRKLFSRQNHLNYLIQNQDFELDKKIDSSFKLWFYFSRYVAGISEEIKAKIPFIEFITLDLGGLNERILEMSIHDLIRQNNSFQFRFNFKEIEQNLKKFGIYDDGGMSNMAFNSDTFNINIIGHIDNNCHTINEISDFFVDFYLDFGILPTIKPIAFKDLGYNLTDDREEQSLNYFFYNKTLVYDKFA